MRKHQTSKKRGMNKRAQEILSEFVYQIIFLVILVALAISAFAVVHAVSKSRFIEKNQYTRDTALLMDALYAAPGGVVIYSGLNLTGKQFSISIQPSRVVLYDLKEK